MSKIDTVAFYLTRITQVRDELAAVGETVADSELVRTALNGFTKQWTSFVKGIVAREKLPDWERLWDDFIQEEIWEESLQGSQRRGNDQENIVLARKSKGKTKKSSRENTSQEGKKRDMNKVKCFACHMFGHCEGQCPNTGCSIRRIIGG